ncbi:MAG: hypothetical protein IT179_17795 [Acidobacteria bacterium]|nr:hypothetical protein [Acidobacteriota bacterium]
MADGQEHSIDFSTDRPIESADQDRLGRRAFAVALAGAIGSWVGRDSLVIALFGAWGSGKSSIKNMVVERLRSQSSPLAVVEFNPWRFAGRDHVQEVFFDQLGIALGKGTIGSSRERLRQLRALRRYSAYLSGVGEVSEVLAPLLKGVVFLVGFLLVGAGWSGAWSAVQWTGWILLGIGGVMSVWHKRLDAVARVIAATVENARPALEDIRDEVRGLLQKRQQPVLVAVDDIDRLTPDQVCEVLQIVKANADFPNVVYLLLCDREVIEKQINTHLGLEGRSYLEKVVQAPFDVPRLEATRVQQILFQGLDRMLQPEAISRRFDEQRWGNLYVGGLQSYFRNLRHVNRFLSTLDFHLQVFRSSSSFEVNPVDLIGLEVLRVFEPKLYQALPEAKPLLLGERAWLRGRSETRRNQERDELVRLLDLVQESSRESVQEILKRLFPPAEWAFGGSNYGDGFSERWARELRVCSSDAFDRYFHFAIPKGDLSQSHIDAIIEAVTDLDALRTIFAGLEQEGLLAVAVDRLEDYKQELPRTTGSAFVASIFDLGERLPKTQRMFEISADMHAVRIVYWFLRKLTDDNDRMRILTEAVALTRGLVVPVRFVSIQEESLAKNEGDEILTAEQVTELKRLCVENIQREAAAGHLVRNPDLLYLLFRWREWSSPDAVREYVQSAVATPAGAVEFLVACVSKSRSQGIDDHVSRVRVYLQLKVVEEFVPIERIEATVSGLHRGTLSSEARQAVEAFEKAVARRRAGKPDYGSGRPWEDEE